VAAPELTLVGRVRRAHGLHGELVIEPLTDVPDAVFAPGRRVFAGTIDGDPAPDGRTLVVEESRPFKGGGWIVAFDGIADRTEAERWRERYVLARKDELTPVAEHEVYLHDLLGPRGLPRLLSREHAIDVVVVVEVVAGDRAQRLHQVQMRLGFQFEPFVVQFAAPAFVGGR